MKYAYYFRSESGDETLILTDKYYEDVYDFMKSEIPEEYYAWRDPEPPYCSYVYVSEDNPINVF